MMFRINHEIFITNSPVNGVPYEGSTIVQSRYDLGIGNQHKDILSTFRFSYVDLILPSRK